MKKIILTSISLCIILMTTPALTAGYKVCYFHDVEYAYIPEHSQCPWNEGNLPPNEADFLIGAYDKVTYNPNAVPKTDIVHSPECFDEHGGLMN